MTDRPHARVLVLVPARGGSKGIPRKNLLPVAGRPLIEWTIRQALAMRAVGDGRADVAVGALSITEEREREFDFTHPFYESGLQILAPVTQQSSILVALDGLAGVGATALRVFACASPPPGGSLWDSPWAETPPLRVPAPGGVVSADRPGAATRGRCTPPRSSRPSS